MAESLGIEPTAKVVKTERLKMVDDDALGYVRSHVPGCPLSGPPREGATTLSFRAISQR